ncbi:MAG: hypothetical protein II399_08390 [Lachnospiraceae bacterium]|nr:hypothetical protein [Lachnospiraceae bacterium]
MTIQELFRKIDKEVFVRYCVSHDEDLIEYIMGLPPEKRDGRFEKYKKRIADVLDEFDKIEAKPSDVIAFVVAGSENDSFPDTFIVYKEELLNSNEPEHYALDFAPWSEIMGYNVSQASFEYFWGDMEIAYSLFHEITFMGFSEESHAKKMDEIRNSLDESMKEIEENPDCFIDADEAFKELEIDEQYKPENREFWVSIIRIQGDAFNTIRKKFFEREKELLLGEKNDY